MAMDRIGAETYWEKELSSVQDAIVSSTWEGKIRPRDAQRLSKMVLLIHEINQDAQNLQPWNDLLTLVKDTDAFSGTSTNAPKVFQAIVRSRPWMTTEMLNVHNVGAPWRAHHTIEEQWLLSKSFHMLYGLPKTTIYEVIVANYSHYGYRTQMDLIDYIKWCLTAEVAAIYLDPKDPRTDSAFFAWRSVSFSPFSAFLTFGTIMRLMPYDLTTATNDGKKYSLSDLMFPVDRYVAHILYPHVFGPAERPKKTSDLYEAASLVIDGYGTLAQVKEVLPYSSAPEDRWLMADVMRHALIDGRLDVAMHYGLGPDTAQLIDFKQKMYNDLYDQRLWDVHPYSRHKSWGIMDFLRKIPDSLRERVLATMGIDKKYAASLLQVVRN